MKLLPILFLLTIPASSRAELPVDREAIARTISQADVASPPVRVPQPAQAVPVAPNRPFCTSDFFVYADKPISGYSLRCSNAALGLVMSHGASYDAASLFQPNGRCSAKHLSTIDLWSRATRPFEFAQTSERPSSGVREFKAYRDGPGLRPGELLVNLLWIQGGDEFRLGFDPRTGRTPWRVFQPIARRGFVYVLRASSVPLNFRTTKRVDGRVVTYRDVPVDCELEITTNDWYGR